MSSYEYEIQTMLWKNIMNKVLIQTLNIGIKDKKNDAVLFFFLRHKTCHYNL